MTKWQPYESLPVVPRPSNRLTFDPSDSDGPGATMTMKKLRKFLSRPFAKRSPPFAVSEAFVLTSGQSVAEICRNFQLQEEAKSYLSEETTPEQFVEQLVRAKLHADATRFLAYALPKREAVWWACLCVRSLPACCGNRISTRALKSAEAWVGNPRERNREMALAAGRRHDFEMPSAPAAWAAMAAGWSDGAMPTGKEEISAPPQHLTAHAASGAILLAATADPDQAAEVYRRFLDTGVEIAQGKMRISS